ncbi:MULTISPECIES: alpha/beta fold hydrolase [unclassified Arthrobacter]|uniref:alpha/beta fold hydrolase n=1 Tax=unclassified Arthrobacter TaxID=235627 RepID=UPI001C84E9FC|nr:alpha/beta fold hydrolase [Arthrobacter sp. MAHUQ-56]MBX7444611.1 alpha/beta fold hydrolase [Arthrobacter sp. MAHUQ-56]
MSESTHTPVVMLHALGVSGLSWSPIKVLLKRAAIQTPDLPGHGCRPILSGQPNDIDTWVDDVMTQISPDDKSGGIHLVGMSLGGIIAARLAARYPDFVKTLTLVATVPRYPNALRDLWRNRMNSVPASGMVPVLEATMNLWFTAEALSIGGDTVAEVRSALLETAPQGYAQACSLLAAADITEDLPIISSKTLVVCGRDDAVAFQLGAETIARLIPNSGLKLIDHGRHAAALERPNVFADILSEHLTHG